MKRRTFRVALAVVPLSALASLASHAASLPTPSGPAIEVPSFVDVDEAFRRATAGRPLDTALLSFASNELRPRASGGGSSGGEIIEDDVMPIEEVTGSVTTVRLLPIAGVEPATARELHRRVALLELLVGALRSYREPEGAPAGRSDEVLQMANTAHLELFVAHSLAYLEGQTREEKCLSYQRAAEHARYVGFDADFGLPVPVRAGWETLLEEARTFHAGPFAEQIPANLCAMRKAVRKAEVESMLRAGIDQRIRLRVEAEIDATSGSLAEKERQYAAALQGSAVELPTREIFLLKKTVEDTASLYELVERDTLGLERAPATTPPGQPLISRLRAKRGEIDRIRSNASAAGVDADVAAARATLERHAALLGAVVAALREIARTPGLDWSTEEKLGVCATIPDALTPENFADYAARVDACLTEAARAYSALKDAAGASDPTRTAFVEKVSGLSKAYIGYINSL
ncbi:MULTISPECIES: hypothetical protein [Sorangium]|uniref:Secreted protein n=1 Tax=Sorangium cellulosum TaxID=56 RepID=A0A4P2QGL0_SORCE|nr:MULTISPECIES: hypothetical protein [Sorangium]AUX28980.1 uncharacterized protein SOCE836_010650 [Sorangium cellulosum]WCQ88374.1 hypothetical protein NQZ70_01050 [Sorangium sp. Soce836]